MDDFFSKYGWVVAVGVVITIVIAMMSPVGQTIKTSVLDFINDMADKLDLLTDKITFDTNMNETPTV